MLGSVGALGIGEEQSYFLIGSPPFRVKLAVVAEGHLPRTDREWTERRPKLNEFPSFVNVLHPLKETVVTVGQRKRQFVHFCYLKLKQGDTTVQTDRQTAISTQVA